MANCDENATTTTATKKTIEFLMKDFCAYTFPVLIASGCLHNFQTFT